MKEEQIRIEVAMAVGWSVSAYEIGNWTLQAPDGRKWEKFSSPEIAWSANCIPDFPNDINAMHQAKLMFTEAQFRTFTDELLKIMRRKCQDRLHTWSNEMLIAYADAGDESEAFLRATNKWTDHD